MRTSICPTQTTRCVTRVRRHFTLSCAECHLWLLDQPCVTNSSLGGVSKPSPLVGNVGGKVQPRCLDQEQHPAAFDKGCMPAHQILSPPCLADFLRGVSTLTPDHPDSVGFDEPVRPRTCPQAKRHTGPTCRAWNMTHDTLLVWPRSVSTSQALLSVGQSA